MKQHLKAFAIVTALALAGLWAYTQFVNQRLKGTPSDYSNLESMERDGVPNFTAKTMEGMEFDLESYRGKVIILNFWASWCGPCIEEVPSLIKLVQEFKGQVQLIAISGDSKVDDIEVFMKSFPEMKGKNIHIVFDEDRSLMKRFQVARLPESLVLNSDLKLVKKIVGSIEWYNEDSVAYIESLLKPTP